MVSPMQRRRLRLEQEKAQKAAELKMHSQTALVKPTSPDAWELIRGTIEADIKQLKSIKPIAGKVEYKTKVLENYRPHLDKPDIPVDIKVLLMVWLFDIGDIGKALEIGQEAVDKSYETPEFIKSSMPEFIADTVYKWSEKQFKAGHSTAPYFDQVFKLVTEKFNTYEVVTSKYYKLAGLMALGKHNAQPRHVSEPDNLKKALAMFIKADEIYDRAGVGTRIAEIKKRLALLLIDHDSSNDSNPTAA